MKKEYLLNNLALFSISLQDQEKKNMGIITYPIIQAPPVMKATTGFGSSQFLGKYKSSLQKKISYESKLE